MRFILILTAILLSVPHIAAAATREVRLQPSSKWILEYADEDCRLIRQFGSSDQAVLLSLDQSEPGDWFRVNFAGAAFTTKNTIRNPKPKIRFGPNEEAEAADGFFGRFGKTATFMASGRRRIAPLTASERALLEAADREFSRMNFAPISDARAKAATRIELIDLLDYNLVLEAGPMDQPLNALRACSWDAVSSWGLNVEQQKTLSRKAAPRQRSSRWFQPDDYPLKMVEEGQQAVVNFRAIIDETGKPVSCTVQRSTRPKDFDDLVCRIIMKRARFDPALDSSGKAVRSYYTQSINWRVM